MTHDDITVKDLGSSFILGDSLNKIKIETMFSGSVTEVKGFLHLSLSQPMCLNPIFGMFLCMFFLCSKFNEDHNYLVLLAIGIDIALFKKYIHKCSG